MTTKKSDNMALWDKVSKTDPAHTKEVKFGRKFTAIDPHSQIMMATKMFGPAGIGWGWTVERVEYTPTNEIAILIGLWHGTMPPYIFQWGQSGLFIDKAQKMKDGDCFKKATTDGLTKCLSYLGFNADVFLGKFDDNKYVEAQRAEHDPKAKEYTEWCKQSIIDLESVKNIDALSLWYTNNKAQVDEGMANPNTKASALQIRQKYSAVKKELITPEGLD